MRKIVRTLLAVVGAILIVSFAVANRGAVEVSFWPMPFVTLTSTSNSRASTTKSVSPCGNTPTGRSFSMRSSTISDRYCAATMTAPEPEGARSLSASRSEIHAQPASNS